jgi:hypothetical protein
MSFQVSSGSKDGKTRFGLGRELRNRSLTRHGHLKYDAAVPTAPLCNNAAVDGKNAWRLLRERQELARDARTFQQHLLLFVSALFDGSRSIFVPDVIGFCAASPLSKALLDTIR